MEKKIILLATFINESYLDKFLYKIYKEFGVKKNHVFIFSTDGGGLVLTYRLFLEFDQKIDIKKQLQSSIQVHKKNTTFFTINSLNTLIHRDFNLPDGNVDYSKYEVDWSKYENTIITIKNGELEFLKLNKINT